MSSGGAKGIRTPDLLIANETLYQLSYSPKNSAPNLLGGVWGLSNVDLVPGLSPWDAPVLTRAA